MASIEIRTAQNVTIGYELASLRERFLAFFYDLLIYYAAYFFMLMVLISTLSAMMTDWGFRFLLLMQLVGFFAYHLLSDVLANGQSPGKKIMGLKVVRLDGREPGLSDYLLRCVFLMVDFVLSLGVLGAILIGSTLRHQRIGDLAANTTVVRVRGALQFRLKDILKIQSKEEYQPRYPAVRQLSEADMLLVKSLLSRSETWRNAAHEEALEEAAEIICHRLKIEPVPRDKSAFLKTLIQDYVVLTR